MPTETTHLEGGQLGRREAPWFVEKRDEQEGLGWDRVEPRLALLPLPEHKQASQSVRYPHVGDGWACSHDATASIA